MEIIYWTKMVLLLGGVYLMSRGGTYGKVGFQLVFLAVFVTGFEWGLPDGVSLQSLRTEGLTDDEWLRCIMDGVFLPGLMALFEVWIAPDLLKLMAIHERSNRND